MKRIAGILFIAICFAIAAPAAVFATQQGTSAVQVAKLNINAATARELQGLPGVGEVTAERIVAYRNEKGKFKSVDDLLKVKGVGKKSLARFRDLISVE